MDDPSRLRRVGADLSLLAVAAIWGLTFPMGKIVLGALPPLTYLAVRFVLGALALAALAPRRLAAVPRREWVTGVAVGAVFFASYVLQTLGLRLTTASKAAFITGLSVVLVPVIEAVWQRLAPRPAVVLGIVAATGGLALLTLNGVGSVNAGDLLVLGCAVGFAFHIVLVGRYARSVDWLGFVASQVMTMAVLGIPAALAERPMAAVAAAAPSIWAMIAFMTATATVGALFIQTWAQRITSAAHTGLMFTFEPVAAAVAAYLILDELLTGRQTWGAALILAGILLAELRPAPARRRTRIPAEPGPPADRRLAGERVAYEPLTKEVP